MTRLFQTLLICGFVFGIVEFSSAQIISKSYSAPVYQSFLKGKTFAVLTDDDTFNSWYKSTLEKQWTIGSLEYIMPAQLDTPLMSDKNFFLVAEAKDEKTGYNRLLTKEDIAKKKEFNVLLSQGGYKQLKSFLAAGTAGSKVLGSFRHDPVRSDLTAGINELEIMICLMNQSLQIITERKIKSVVKDSVKWVITDEDADKMRDKTLLINRAYCDGSLSLEEKPLIAYKVLEDYAYDYVVVGKDSVQQSFEEPTDADCYLFLYFPSPRLKVSEDSGDIVYDASRKKILYYEDNVNGPWFEKWKMKQMVTFIKRK